MLSEGTADLNLEPSAPTSGRVFGDHGFEAGVSALNVTIFVGFCCVMVLTIWGRRLRESAFRALSAEQRISVIDKLPNYTATEAIPLAGLILALVGLVLFRPQWLRVGFAVFAVLFVLVVTVFHLRTRHRFRHLGLPTAFLSAYEYSRFFTYSGLAATLGWFGWVVYRYF